jgi:hypothetical protein
LDLKKEKSGLVTVVPNEEFHNMYCSANIIIVIKLMVSSMHWGDEKLIQYSVRKPERIALIGRRRRSEDNVKIVLK